MVFMAVYAAGRKQSEDVQRGGTRVDGLAQHRVARQLAAGDGRVDPGEVLRNGAPGPDAHVTDLGVAHLPGRQAHVESGRGQFGRRRAGPHGVPDGGAGMRDGVVRKLVAQAPTVEDHEQGGAFTHRIA